MIEYYYAVIEKSTEKIMFIDDDAERVAMDCNGRSGDYAEMVCLKRDSTISKEVRAAFERGFWDRENRNAELTK